jgi:hypothetical protein
MHGGIIKEGVMGVLKIQLDALSGNYKERIRNKVNKDYISKDADASEANPVIRTL